MLFPLILPLLSSCNSDPPADKIVVVTGGGHSAASAADHAQHSFPCCDQEAVTAVIQAYVALGDALADDSLERSHAQGAVLAARALEASASDALSEADRQRAGRLAELAAPWGGDPIEGIRADLTDVAAEALPLAVAHRGGDAIVVVTAFCPMAPGRWLQSGTALKNPYFGAEMLSCGIFEAAPQN